MLLLLVVAQNAQAQAPIWCPLGSLVGSHRVLERRATSSLVRYSLRDGCSVLLLLLLAAATGTAVLLVATGYWVMGSTGAAALWVLGPPGGCWRWWLFVV